MFPHLETLAPTSPVFRVDFGLEELPEEGGILLIRGPRQYGKSTWLEAKLRESVVSGGPASAFYLNGDELRSEQALGEAIRELAPLFRVDAPFRRLFIDEITAIRGWERAVKVAVDWVSFAMSCSSPRDRRPPTFAAAPNGCRAARDASAERAGFSLRFPSRSSPASPPSASTMTR
jgi:hypothetical protein